MQNIYRTFIRTYYYIFDFVVPRFCVGCRKEHEVLCPVCSEVEYQKWANCLLCGARNMTGSFCVSSCRKQVPTALKKVYWVGKYDNMLKTAVAQLKYQKRKEIAGPLGRLMAKKFLQYSENFDSHNYCIVPIPLHPSKHRERGFNQAELLAYSFGKETNIEVEPKFLKKIINTNPQAKTPNRKERMKNLKDAFVADRNYGSPTSIVSKTIILVDDVSTTGATLFHASEALVNVGATNIIGIVAAHG